MGNGFKEFELLALKKSDAWDRAIYTKKYKFGDDRNNSTHTPTGPKTHGASRHLSPPILERRVIPSSMTSQTILICLDFQITFSPSANIP